MVSPADGAITNISFQDGITYFVVGLSFWDVHVVRTPVAGVVKNIEAEGLHFDRNLTSQEAKEAIFLRGKAAPVQQIVTLDTDYGEVKVRLITSYWASRIKVWVHLGQKLGKGERIGRMLLGSTVAVEFPGRVTNFLVRPKQRVVGGETVILPTGQAP
jgi:phosphatidylserine decarboxylase